MIIISNNKPLLVVVWEVTFGLVDLLLSLCPHTITIMVGLIPFFPCRPGRGLLIIYR